MKIKVSDYIAKRLTHIYKVRHVFMISGGGAMHLNDSFGHSKINYICNHNEQASAIAAEGYARLNQDLGVVCVTTGPGGINALNGLFGQWTDSTPVLYISGQVKFSTTMASCPQIPLRQLGDQEVDIVSVVKSLTKYAVMVSDPLTIKYHLDKAIYLAQSGRKGPVWLDIPLNVQAAIVEERELKSFKMPARTKHNLKIKEVISTLKKAKRPLIVAGHGIRISGMVEEARKLVKILNVPAVATFNGLDLIANDNPLFAGRIGTSGSRAGNFALQNADCILFLGTRNNIRQVSYNWENFAKNAYKIVVDIDKAELDKPTVKPDLKINADLKDFLPALLKAARPARQPSPWPIRCHTAALKYTPVNEHKLIPNGKVSAYHFIETLTSLLPENGVLVGTNGTACIGTFQAAFVKGRAQRMFLNSGNASMGYGLPAAIGACAAGGGRSVICLEGDGSIMMNLQELQTLKHYNLPVKVFIINNNGYISIKQTQRNFFGRFAACGTDCGVSMPDFTAVTRAFGLPAFKIRTNKDIEKTLKKLLSLRGPLVCEVITEDDYIFKPKLSSKKLPDGSMISPTLEDMYPFLPEEELRSNIIK
ncbi:MAG: thiamine pyrophosphate-binding protein [Elusimicrobiota bacterium]|jgi:acetolactate synthase-1/2/3 large subunit|nr:thiamine pyrophosphate-binding protein [Elusimicrobiota bacterium]